jgi:ribonuclease HI
LSSKSTYKFYAVRNGRVPGIYTDWPSAQKQITGWSKPVHKCFSTRAEAQRFLDGTDKAQEEEGSDHIDGKRKKAAKVKEQEFIGYEPGVEDGFDPNILLQIGTGNVIIKSRSQKAATRVQALGPAPGTMLRVYTDGSALGNGKQGAFAGVGVYFGPSDSR